MCSQHDDDDIKYRDFSDCQPASKFVATTSAELSQQFGREANALETIDNDSIYENLISQVDEATASTSNCQIFYSASSREADCRDCLKELYLKLKSVRSYLVTNQVGNVSIAKQDIELIQAQIELE